MGPCTPNYVDCIVWDKHGLLLGLQVPNQASIHYAANLPQPDHSPPYAVFQCVQDQEEHGSN